MPTFVKRSELAVPPSELYAWHMRPGAFERLTPVWAGMRVVEGPPVLESGARARLELRLGPLRLAWCSRYEVEPGSAFRDVQERGPMRAWIHDHRFLPGPDGGSILEDAIDYELPAGEAGRLLAGARVERRLRRLFEHRHAVTRADLERHAEVGQDRRLSVAVSGASGLVGSALVPFLTAGGHTVRRLSRRTPIGADEIAFDPVAGRIDARELEGLDAVVHLAGESVSGGRWTPEKKRRILDSRVAGTRLLAEALAGLGRPPAVLVSASAIGIYGDRAEELVDESNAQGSGFLADVCRAWEAAAEPAEKAGIRVVKLRIGIVLGVGGGALGKMLPAFRAGVGGRVGAGRQWMSWIGLDDLLGLVLRALFDRRLAGPVNAVAPHPVRNEEFAATLGRVLGRPARMPLPAAVVSAVFGEMGRTILLGGVRVAPARLEAAGFRFRHPDLESAVRFELGI